jgi:riboflavin synthase
VFTGIVEELGRVVAVEHGAQSARLTVEGAVVGGDVGHGASIAVDGVCPTAVEHDGRSTVDDEAGTFDVSLTPTTFALITLGHRRVGDLVNLEVDVLAKYVERLLRAGSTVAEVSA